MSLENVLLTGNINLKRLKEIRRRKGQLTWLLKIYTLGKT